MSMGYENNNYRGGNHNGERKGPRDPVTYSDMKFKNPNSVIDPTSVSFQFMYGLLNVSISPKKADASGSGEYISYDYNNAIQVWLSYKHAYVLKEEIKKLIELNDPTKLKFVGTATTKDVLIDFGFGHDYGTENYILRIMKLNSDGAVQNCYVYEFTDAGYSAIENFDQKTKKYAKYQLEKLEVNMFLTLLEEYVSSYTGAYAYMNRFYNKFETSSRYQMLSGICEKLGVQVGKANYSKQKEGFFINGGGNQQESDDGFTGMNKPTNNKFRESSFDDMIGSYDIDD